MSAAGTVRVDVAELGRFATDVLDGLGMPADHVRRTVDAMTWADLRGLAAHGVPGKLPQCAGRILAGGTRADPDIRVVTDLGALALMDADDGWGQVAGSLAMDAAIGRAGRYGVGSVSVRRTGSAAALGHFAARAAARGLIGLAVSNGPALMAAPEGAVAVIGNQAHALACPGGDAGDFLYDSATSVMSTGALEVCAATGRRLPPGVLRDPDGAPVHDAARWRTALLEPIGGHHGFGLSLALEILTGVLSGGAARGPVGWPGEHGVAQQVSLWCLAMRCDLGRSRDEVVADVERLRRRVADSGHAGGPAPRLPGQRGHTVSAEIAAHGVALEPADLQRLAELAQRTGVSPPAPRS